MKQQLIYDKWSEFLKQYEKYFKNKEQQWNDTFDILNKYVNENKKRPYELDKDPNVKKLGIWVTSQQGNYKKRKEIMKRKNIAEKWKNFINEYRMYFRTNDEIWNDMLEIIIKYIHENKKRPSATDKNTEIKKMGRWIKTQQQNYTHKKHIMKDEKIRKIWEKFVNKYKEYFSDEEHWKNMLNNVKIYIDNNKKIPPLDNNNIKIKQLRTWIGVQQRNYSQKNNIMKNLEIRKLWEKFISEYKEYFKKN
jgi:hypothetical protein